MGNVLFQEVSKCYRCASRSQKRTRPGRRDWYLISIPKLFRHIPKGKKSWCMNSASRAAPCVAPAPSHGEPSFAGLVLFKNMFIKAPLNHTTCSVPFHDTLVSSMRVYPIPAEFNPIEILKFICALISLVVPITN